MMASPSKDGTQRDINSVAMLTFTHNIICGKLLVCVVSPDFWFDTAYFA